jgi:uncharacterized protein YndB with AHSA1/START domain
MLLDVQTPVVTVTRTIKATPAQIYYAFTNATALRGWMCNRSNVNAAVGGSYFLAWNQGYYTAGEFTALEQDRLIEMTWQGRGEPGPTNVEILIEIDEDGTRITITHSELGEGELWATVADQFEKEWTAGLDNLKSVLETGVDLRQANRAAFGLMGATMVDAERAARLGLPEVCGMSVGGIMEGMAAANAGLQEGDVIMAVGGKKFNDFNSYLAVMGNYTAHETAEVDYWRDGKMQQTAVTFIPFKFPDPPATAAEFAANLQVQFAEVDAEMDALLQGVSEAEASHQPAPGEWCVKEVLAHLIRTERQNHFYIHGVAGGDDYVAWPDNSHLHIVGTLAAYPTLADLVQELKRSEAATVALAAALPDAFVARKGDFGGLARNLALFANHNRNHFAQMQAAIDSARTS